MTKYKTHCTHINDDDDLNTMLIVHKIAITILRVKKSDALLYQQTCIANFIGRTF